MKTPAKMPVWFIASAVVAVGLFFSGSSQLFAKDAQKLEKEITRINKELKTIDASTKVIKENKKGTTDLQKLHKAQQSGLSAIVKTITPQGGRFEILPDGAIRITPDDKSIVNKLMAKGSPGQNASSDKNISKQSREILERLQKANKQGLSILLKKLSTGGGRFELIENGGIRIIPNNATEAKALVKKTDAARKLADKRKLGRLSHKLRLIGSWSKARAAAKSWLKKEKREGLSIGKIRLVKWLYIVSIVTQKGNMDTQLVIRASDGKTVAFSPGRFEVFN